MKRILALALVASLSACALTPPPAPVDVADKTALDEQAGITATVAYTAASRLGLALARAGIIDKAKFKALDARGYAAVLAIKAAYDAGNSASYFAAIEQAKAATAQISALVK